jgi:hypothetical protein
MDDSEARLARKAASARQARLRHKDHVQGLEDEIRQLHLHCAELEAKRLAAAQAASQRLRADLHDALPPEQWQTLCGWLGTSTAVDQLGERETEEEEATQPAPSVDAVVGEVAPEVLLYALASRARSSTRPWARQRATSQQHPPLVDLRAARVQAHAADARGRRAKVTATARQCIGGPGVESVPLHATVVSTPASAADARYIVQASTVSKAPSIVLGPPHVCVASSLDPQSGGTETSPTSVMENDLLECALGIVGLAGARSTAAPRGRPARCPLLSDSPGFLPPLASAPLSVLVRSRASRRSAGTQSQQPPVQSTPVAPAAPLKPPPTPLGTAPTAGKPQSATTQTPLTAGLSPAPPLGVIMPPNRQNPSQLVSSRPMHCGVILANATKHFASSAVPNRAAIANNMHMMTGRVSRPPPTPVAAPILRAESAEQ